MAHRIEVISTIPDARAGTRLRDLQSREFRRLVNGIELVDVYTLDGDFPVERLNKVRDMLTNPVSQSGRVDDAFMPDFNYAVEIGFLPGVTDNVGNTAREGVSNLLDIDSGLVHSSQLMFLRGGLSASDAQRVGEAFANPLIQSIRVRDYASFFSNEGMGVYVPRVRIDEIPSVGLVDILGADDEELGRIGKLGIANEDGSRRGPLALDLTYMNAIRDHFQALGRNPTDVELESLGQTWSEHCKHTIFADPIDEIGDGLYEHFIKRATSEIRGAKGVDDFCVSVFTDNSGAIDFDDRWLITDKVETHNSPSALDPFGGSITGIVGVNRDAIGSGLGAMPVANRFGFCFADPNDERPLYKGEGKTQRMLSSRRIMDGVIDGVNVGGNQSGIPTPQGFAYYDERFKGKPLVFVGTVGLMPRESAGRLSHEKSAEPGDYAVMIGGRVGKDGIHGATFSSEAMDSDSPVGAVQIGDPITQKKLSDAVVREARDRGLYTSITDNGAGGLSCSVAEMAKESGGCRVDLDKVPLKYEGMQPWEIWVSESQERMTLSVPPSKWEEFSGLMKRRGVEATVIGEFNDSGNCVVDYDGNTVMDMKMSFLHDGLPRREINTTFSRGVHDEPEFDQPDSLNGFLHSMLARNNLASSEFISSQYDHEVQGGSVIKPLQGRGMVNGDASVFRPVLDSRKGVVLSHGLNPNYSDIDTYHMAASAIDTAVRNALCVGANLDTLALLDNFCWCSSDEPERLGQLKRAAQACYDVAVDYGTPFISGKDSMFNDFKGYDSDGDPIKVSIPPTLLVSSIGVMDDVRNAVSLDAKAVGDSVYVLGNTEEHLGGSEYFDMVGENERGKGYVGNSVPVVDTEVNGRLYRNFSDALDKGLVASAQSVNQGGLLVALAKTAMGGRLGMELDMSQIPGGVDRDDYALFSESQGRIVVTVDPMNERDFQAAMEGSQYSKIGIVRDDDRFLINSKRGQIVDTNVNEMLGSYRSTFEGY